MKLYRLGRTQVLPISLAECWDFFSDPRNLPTITPPWLGFDVSQTRFARMYPGQVFEYRVSPLLVPMQWVTEITHVVEPYLFVDEQRFGPYRFWHHEHHFREVEGGVHMEDVVHYGLPLGPLGRLAHVVMVRRQVNAIFDYRYDALARRFGATPTGSVGEFASSPAALCEDSV